MPRDLASREFDLLIIGAGACGAAAAREAARRGLRVALIERADFGAATSAECFKMVHGGIRYLQHADIKRLRASCRERSAFLRTASHLVQPLPILIPTYGRGRRGRALLGAGACVYDLLTLDRNRGIRDPARRIRSSRQLTRAEVLQFFPHLDAPDLSGAVLFEDGQMHNPARLVLAFVKDAVAAGANACNYVEALRFLWQGGAVRGARVRDQLSGEEFDLRARLTLNAAGPWADYLARDPQRFGPWVRGPYSRDAYFIVDRAPTSAYAVAVQGLSRDKDAVLGRATRHLFAVPWRDKTLLGVWHRLFAEPPDQAQVTMDEVAGWMTELNTVYPALELSADEVQFANCGLVPFGATATDSELSFGKEARVTDHRQAHGVEGLVSLAGIRFTTARADAASALELLLEQAPRAYPRIDTTRLTLPGGDIESCAALEAHALRTRPAHIDARTVQALVRNHGTEYRTILAAAALQPDGAAIAGTLTLRAEIAHAVEKEMAVKLEDVVMRRTDIAAGCHPGRRVLELTAAEMARKLAWSSRQVEEEIAATERTLARHLARPRNAATSAQPAAEPLAAAGAMLATVGPLRSDPWTATPLPT